MIKKNVSLIVLIILTVLFLSDPVHGKEDPKNSAPDKKKDKTVSEKKENRLSGWVGYNWYEMNDFNAKLSRENNKTIDGGFNAGVEFTLSEVTTSLSSIPGIGKIIVKLPPDLAIGIEYLEAGSKTSHGGPSGDTTVNWELPVVGTYASLEWPEIKLFGESDWRCKWRPIGIGYYKLGDILDAQLTVSDCPGHLKVSDDSIGITSQIGIKYLRNNFEAFVEGGYRYLRFTDVLREPEGGFSPNSASIMPETLDYSGFIIKAGICIKF